MKIVHTYINNMYIDPNDESKMCFADKWGLVSLAKLGHDVTLICGGESKERNQYIWKGITVIELPKLWGINNTSRILKGFIRELKKIQADVFHSHHYSSLIPELTLIVGKKRKIPTFVTFHNTLVEGNFFAKTLGTLYLIGMQPFLPFYHKVLFISDYIKNKLPFKLLSKKKKQTIYNYIYVPKLKEISKKKNMILYVGRLTHQKGIDILFKSLSQIKKNNKNVKLFLMGTGTKKYVQHLQKLVESFNLKNHVIFLGKKSGDEKWHYYQQSTILIVPSRDEGFGNVVIEGMLAETPVIVSNKGSLPEASGGKGIVFNIHKPEDLAKKIMVLLNDQHLQGIFSENAKHYAEKFTKDTIGKELLQEYKHSLSTRN